MDETHRERLDDYLDREDLEAVWFARPNSFGWLTGGGDSYVSHHAALGVGAVGYDGDGLHVVTDNIEAPRLREEEIPEGATVHTFEWYEGDLAATVADVSPEPAAADFEVPGSGFADVEAARELRQPLTDREIERYRDLSADATDAMEAVCEAVTPSTTEDEAAGLLKRECRARGIEAPVALVGSGERAPKYRHYTTKDVEIGGYCLVSVTAFRGGLYTSLTRTVAFDPPEWLYDRWEAAARVETTALAATREAGRERSAAGDVFGAIKAAYAEQGWAEEWRNHHQGGASGFAGREWFGEPGSQATVYLPQGYAWNPTVQGAKSEGTWLVRADGVEALTRGDGDTRTFEAVGYDLELAHPVVVDRT
jgi:Xaa-Pro aminopeptidase